MHSFYRKSPAAQKLWLSQFAALLLLLTLGLGLLCYWLGVTLLALFFSALLLSAFASFFDTPSLVRKGHLRYFSPLLLAEREKKGKLHLHGGSLFDYYFVLRKVPRGKRKRRVLQLMLEALLAVSEQYPATLGSEPKILITSYFFQAKTAGRLGFEPIKKEQVQALKVFIGFPQVFLAYSLLAGRPKMPPLDKLASYRATPQSLAAAQKDIKLLLRPLARNGG